MDPAHGAVHEEGRSLSARPGFRRALAREQARLRARPWDIAVLSLLPLAFGLLVWWIFSAGVPRGLPLAVVDDDHSALSRQLLRWVDATPGVQLTQAVPQAADGFAALRRREAFGVLVIPAGFARALLTGQSATVELYTNAQFSSHAGALSQAVRGAVGTLSAGIEIAAREKRGSSVPMAQAQFEPIRVQLVTLFNETLNYELFMGGSLLPALLQIAAMLAAVSAVGRELKDGSVPRWLAAAGGHWPRALAAKLFWPTLAMLALAALYLVGFAVVRGYEVRGSGAAVAVGLVGLVLASEAMGLLMLGATLSFRMGLSLTAFYAGAAFAFSGQGFPLMAMPPLARTWAAAIPLTHYLQLHNRHWLEGAPWSYAGPELGALALFVVLGFGGGGLLLARRANQPSAWGRA